MNEEIEKLEKCLQAMKNCLKIPHVEDCVCFSDAFKVLGSEMNELYKKTEQLQDLNSKEKAASLKKEIEEIKMLMSRSEKECIGCNPCIASVVFKAYPDRLNSLYLNDEL